MTQLKLAEREQSARVSVSRAARIMMLLAVAAVLAAMPVSAAAHPLRARRVGIARQPDRFKIDRVNVRSGTARAHSGHVSNERSRVRRVAVERNSERNIPVMMEHARAVKRTAARRRRTIAHRDVRSSPQLHRVSARRRRGVHHRVAEQEMAQSSTEPRNKPLTVTDFVRAADKADRTSKPSMTVTVANRIYASGESHPDENVSESNAAVMLGNPVRANMSPAKSIVEAAPTKADMSVARGAMSSAPGDARARQELTSEVEQPLVLPGLYRNGRLVVPRPLRGTREILVHQNLMADDEGLQRVQNDYDLQRMRASRQLVDFPESASLHVNPEMESDRRCARPWTVYFATDISRAFYARFHEPLQVNSAVRTVAYQVRLRRVNGNAAGVDGEAASPHLTGEALDFGKHSMSVQEIAWMRLYLLPLMEAGKLDVEEEFQQACFHISVYRTYESGPRRRSAGRSEVAQLR